MLFLSSFLMNAGMTILLRLSSGLFSAENHTGAGGKNIRDSEPLDDASPLYPAYTGAEMTSKRTTRHSHKATGDRAQYFSSSSVHFWIQFHLFKT